MSSHDTEIAPQADKLFRVVLIFAVIFVIVKGIATGFYADDVYAEVGNDGIMRLMSVRDLLAGQAWYDMTQYRILPEDGLSIHWSRYVDLGIGAIIWVFALFVPMGLAEQIGGVLWPVFLIASLITLTGSMTRQMFGPAAGVIAMIMVVSYPPLASGYFKVGQVDHHNVQIVLMTLSILALTCVKRPVVYGIVSGLAGAMSLAIGLETLFLVAIISIMHVYVAAMESGIGARNRLWAYCGAIVAGTVLFYAGQTPPVDWLVRQCDELSTPYLSVVAIGALSGAVGLGLTARGRAPAKFLIAVAGTSLLGLIVAWPLVGACLQSPYGDLPLETQEFIATRILEAQSLLSYFESTPINALVYYGGALIVLLLASFAWLTDKRDRDARAAAGYLILIGWFGFAACFWQVRQVVVLAATVPALTGYVVGPLLVDCLRTPTRNGQLTLMAVAMVTLFQPGLVVIANRSYAAISPIFTGEPTEGFIEDIGFEDDACSDVTKISALNTIAPTTVLTGINLGPMLIMATHHSALAAPYHRSNAALTNASAYDVTDAASFLDRLSQIGASAVVVCEGTTYGSDNSIGSRLARGDVIDGLTPVPLEVADLLVFVVEGAA